MVEQIRDGKPETALHWYDFVCPFCYVGQHRTAILVGHRFDVIELPFQAHPEIPNGGMAAGPRVGPTYRMLEQEARAAGLSLRWPGRIPNSRVALAAAEWVRRNRLRAFAELRKSLFEAHFVLGEDLEDLEVIDGHARMSGVDLAALDVALGNCAAARAVVRAEAAGRGHSAQHPGLAGGAPADHRAAPGSGIRTACPAGHAGAVRRARCR